VEADELSSSHLVWLDRYRTEASSSNRADVVAECGFGQRSDELDIAPQYRTNHIEADWAAEDKEPIRYDAARRPAVAQGRRQDTVPTG
jgi:hypothetical protein